jgi:RNA polymerase-interacting CarD/CdnL/TRCF family regulator
MVPLSKAESVGLRQPIPKVRLSRLWRILRGKPEALPDRHKERYALIEGKLHEGDRDLAWRREEKRTLTRAGARLYETGPGFIASEVAGAQGSDVGRRHL